ncbi:MAG: hypothetical protein DRH11_18040 [Deltaproteobacteria bacterium]|nr:MAG: hypothetical protein DRH11_18040 [Deltaproteobacteria bacterium]
MSLRNRTLYVNVALAGLLLLLVTAILILSCVPPVSKDALVHHLAVPKLYLKHGGIYEIPFMPFSYYPMNLDLLYLIPLYFGNDIAPKFIHFGFALLTAWLIFKYLGRRTGIEYALGGGLFFLSIPIIVKLSITVYVDLGLIFFSTASLLLVLKWVELDFPPKYLLLSAISCGLAAGTKYNGLIVLFLLKFFVPFLYSRYTRSSNPSFSRSAFQGVIFLGVALLVFSPWMIKNYLWTNNPIYPLYDHWFNPQGGAGGSINVFAFRASVYGETWWQMALLPVRIFFQGRDGNPQYFDGKLNPFLFLLPFFVFVGIRKESRMLVREIKILALFSALYFAFAFFSTDLRVRYILPIIPALIILSVLGVKNMYETLRGIHSSNLQKCGRGVLLGALCLLLGLNAHYVLNQFRYVKPFDYLCGLITRDEYIEKYRFEYPVIRYINEKLPQSSLILFIFVGKRGYYCNRPYVLDMGRNGSSIQLIVKKATNSEEVLSAFQKRGITHLLIRYDIFDKWKRDEYIFTDREMRILDDFMRKYTRLLFYKWGYGISKLQEHAFS